MKWQDCLESKIAKRTLKNTETARSLYKTAVERKNLIDSYGKNVERFAIEGCYEALVELIHALLSINGFKSYSHECSIEFLGEFYSDVLEKSEIMFLQRLRMLRNLIKYEGKEIEASDASYWLEGGCRVFEKLKNILSSGLEQP